MLSAGGRFKFKGAVWRSSAIVATAFLAAVCISAEAAYPERAVRVVVGASPGGATDLISRVVFDALAKRTGASFFIESKAGAAGVIAAESVANSPPDGYTLMVGSNSIFTTHPSLYKKLPYNPATDFVPTARLVSGAHALMLQPSSPFKSLKELIDTAREKPNVLTYGSGGNGTTSHLSALLFLAEAGVQMLHIPYRGTAPATIGLLSGEVDLLFDTLSSAIPQLASGKLQSLGITSQQRFSGLPNVPTISEQGLPKYEMVFWLAVFAPRGTPTAIIEFLEKEVAEVLALESTKERLAALGAVPYFAPGQQLAAAMAKESKAWATIFEKFDIKPQ